jgi:hypothetical protein
MELVTARWIATESEAARIAAQIEATRIAAEVEAAKIAAKLRPIGLPWMLRPLGSPLRLPGSPDAMLLSPRSLRLLEAARFSAAESTSAHRPVEQSPECKQA